MKTLLQLTLLLGLFACSAKTETNPVVYVEIPVTDLDRATTFYSAVFGYSFTRDTIDGNEMALFPLVENGHGIGGALAKGPAYRPSTAGAIIYFHTDDMESTLARAIAQGTRALYPVTDNGDLGRVAEIQDSEGNRIALHQAAKGR